METPAQRFARDEIGKTVSMLNLMLVDANFLASVERAAELCGGALKSGHKILFAGNGGSAADAQHLAAELVGRLDGDRPGLAAVALTTDSSVLTALGNDYGYEEVFRRQIQAIGAAGDVFVGISTSGRSKNVLRALEEARAKGLVRIGMTGAGGGQMATMCDVCLEVPTASTQKIQEGHIIIGHIICGLIERQIFPKS